jgi:hypothetical protein
MLKRTTAFGFAAAATGLLCAGAFLLFPTAASSAPGGGTPSTNIPPPPPPPPGEDDGDGGYGGHHNGGGGYDDSDESPVVGCSAYVPVSSAYVVSIHPTSSNNGDYGETRPYIQDQDWAGFQANPGGTWFVCNTATREWFDYIAGATAAIDFHDQLTPPEVVFRPEADRAIVEFDTYVALASNGGVDGYGNMPIDENVPFYDWEARPRRIVWTPGDGSAERSCEIPDNPRPQAEEIPSETDEGCSYRYERPSVGEPESAFQAEIRVEYEVFIRLANGGAWRLAPGDNPILGQPSQVGLHVGELQAVAVGS